MSQLERKPSLDTFLMDDQKEKEESNGKYQQMQEFRKKLPSYSMKEVNDLFKYILYLCKHERRCILFEI